MFSDADGMALGGDVEGKESLLFREQATESLIMLQGKYRKHKLNVFGERREVFYLFLFLFLPSFCRCHKWGGGGHGQTCTTVYKIDR